VTDFNIGWLETTLSSIIVTSQDNDTLVFNNKGELERVIKTGHLATGHACRGDSLVIKNLDANDKAVISVFSIRTGYITILLSWLMPCCSTYLTLS